MINGCETCKRYRDCDSDPAVCEEYEVDEDAYVSVNLAELMRSVSKKFRRVSVQKGYMITVTLETPMEDAEKDAAVTLLSARLDEVNQEARLIRKGEVQVVFEVEEKIPEGWPPEEEE